MGRRFALCNAFFGQCATHAKHLIHLRFGFPWEIAPNGHTRSQVPQPSQFASRYIFTPALLRQFFSIYENGFLYDAGNTTDADLPILPSSGSSSSKRSNSVSDTYECFVGIYAAATMLWAYRFWISRKTLPWHIRPYVAITVRFFTVISARHFPTSVGIFWQCTGNTSTASSNSL